MTTQAPALPGTTIVAANEKGGVGKTFVTVALAVMLTYHLKLRVLVVDMDPQLWTLARGGTKEGSVFNI